MSIFKNKEFPDPSVNPSEREFEVNNWVISDFIVKTIVPVVGVHPFPLNELMLMVAAVCRFKPTLIFEWGTHIGKSARIFRETVKAFKIPCAIHSIDLPDDVHHGEHPHSDRGKMVRGMKEVTLHQGDGVARSLELLQANAGRGRVLFFVDGDHSYDTVKRELLAILRAEPNAIVLLHDTFLQSPGSGYNVGPYEAINEVLASLDGDRETISTRTGLPGMTLVFPRKLA